MILGTKIVQKQRLSQLMRQALKPLQGNGTVNPSAEFTIATDEVIVDVQGTAILNYIWYPRQTIEGELFRVIITLQDLRLTAK